MSDKPDGFITHDINRKIMAYLGDGSVGELDWSSQNNSDKRKRFESQMLTNMINIVESLNVQKRDWISIRIEKCFNPCLESCVDN